MCVYPYVITCDAGKKSKMAGNSTSKPLKNELPCTTGGLRGRSSMHSLDTQCLIFQIGIFRYL